MLTEQEEGKVRTIIGAFDNGKSVTELNAATTLGDNDVMEVLQGGENKKVPVSVVKESVNSDVLTEVNKRGVFNATVSVPLSAGAYYTLSTAIASVPTASKSLGLDLKFSTGANTWVVYRYKGADLSGWATTTNWEQVPDAAKLTSLETDLNIIQENSSTYAVNGKQNSLLPAGMYWGGISQIVAAGSGWDGIIIYLYKGVTEFYMEFSSTPSAYLFDTKPVIGMATNLGSAIISTLPDGVRKISVTSNQNGLYVLLSVRVSTYPINTFYILHNYSQAIPSSSVYELGSNLIQDDINLAYEKQFKIQASGKISTSIVFVYDDYYDQAYVDLFLSRGIKLTFALIGNIDKDNVQWKQAANKVRELTLYGHGTCAHGVVGGVSVPSVGIDLMNDSDVKTATDGENKSFDDYKLSHRGLVQYNTWEDNPHTWKLVGNYYDYVIGFSSSKYINHPSDTDLYQIKRANTDTPNMVASWKTKIEEAIIAGNCIIAFGGHFTRTGTGGTYSTMNEFIEFLDYVKKKIDNGQLISLNTDDAIDHLWRKSAQLNCINYSNYNYRNPSQFSIKYDNGIKICTNKGTKATYRFSISGLAQQGEFTLNVGNSVKTTNTSICQAITIQTNLSESIESIIDKIVKVVYKAFTVRKENNTELIAYRDINGLTFTPYVTNNTSGLIFTVTEIASGTEAIWS